MLHRILLKRTHQQTLSKKGIQIVKTLRSVGGSNNSNTVITPQQAPILSSLSSTRRPYHSTPPSCDTVNITFQDSLEKEHTVPAEVGKSLLDVAHDNNIELEGACGGELACATCHLIFSQEMYDTLPEKEPEEDDMLDLAFELTDTSRLGCQICVRKDMEGMIVRIPDDGY